MKAISPTTAINYVRPTRMNKRTETKTKHKKWRKICKFCNHNAHISFHLKEEKKRETLQASVGKHMHTHIHCASIHVIFSNSHRGKKTAKLHTMKFVYRILAAKEQRRWWKSDKISLHRVGTTENSINFFFAYSLHQYSINNSKIEADKRLPKLFCVINDVRKDLFRFLYENHF